MMNPSDVLKKHLHQDAKNGSPLAILFAQIVLFIATIFVWRTRLYAEHDRTGFKTALSYQILAILVSNSNRLSRPPGSNPRPPGSNPRPPGSNPRPPGSNPSPPGSNPSPPGSNRHKVNLIENVICLILTPVFEKFYEKSLSSLGFALSITVLFLILLVIIRPSTDLGLFGFLIGVIGSVACNLFGLNFQIWIVMVICFLLVGFRIWLDWKWLEVGQDQLPVTGRSAEEGVPEEETKFSMISKIIELLTELTVVGFQVPKEKTKFLKIIEVLTELTVVGFHLFWVSILFRTNCQAMHKSISCSSSSVMVMLASLVIFNLWFGYKLISRVYSLLLIVLLVVGVGCLHKREKKPRKKNRKTKMG
ncbi:hypothetical protein SLEP1_g15876 [Rubroshorea leprosula]|uniref:Transmembrane protein n=1 Tax=Rubroshorea leprosula TaxID=152421 RepID=A0AAV5IY86_9ROSI|nr:hypothetical protein SLEP1_g15876 [Rubroshorea leprosula]